MGRRLTNVEVDFISLVKKGANKQPITIFKSADYEEPNHEVKGLTVEGTLESGEEIGKSEETKSIIKFFNVLKNFFGGGEKEAVVKAADINTEVDYKSFNSVINSVRKNIYNACWTLQDTIDAIFWDDKITNGKELILKNIEEFKTYIEGILNSETSVQKDFFRKDSDRAKEAIEVLKSITDGLNETILKSKRGVDETVNREEIQALLEPITKSIEDLSNKVDSLTKLVEKVEEAEGKVEEKAQEVAKAAAEAETTSVVGMLEEIQKSLDSINNRVTNIEEFRGISAQEGEPTEVEKSDLDPEEAFWAGIL